MNVTFLGRYILALAVILLFAGRPSHAQTMSLGGDHSCATTTGGKALCWGRNDLGELGNNSDVAATNPVFVRGNLLIGGLGGGTQHSCAVTVQGALYCWGWNAWGQVGNGVPLGVSEVRVPTQVNLGSGVLASSVTGGGYHSCALHSQSGVSCWGRNSDGQLGNDTTIDSVAPVEVSFLPVEMPKQISAGARHTCAVMLGGMVRCWGDNADGQLGDGSMVDSAVPVAVALGNVEALKVEAGHSHTCALLTSGEVKCWGLNDRGQLGDASSANSSAPVLVHLPIGSSASDIATGFFSSCAALTSGDVYCWGASGAGQLGDGFVHSLNDFSSIPTLVALPVFNMDLELAAEGNHACARKPGLNAVWCWGARTISSKNGMQYTIEYSPTLVRLVSTTRAGPK